MLRPASAVRPDEARLCLQRECQRLSSDAEWSELRRLARLGFAGEFCRIRRSCMTFFCFLLPLSRTSAHATCDVCGPPPPHAERWILQGHQALSNNHYHTFSASLYKWKSSICTLPTGPHSVRQPDPAAMYSPYALRAALSTGSDHERGNLTAVGDRVCLLKVALNA